MPAAITELSVSLPFAIISFSVLFKLAIIDVGVLVENAVELFIMSELLAVELVASLVELLASLVELLLSAEGGTAVVVELSAGVTAASVELVADDGDTADVELVSAGDGVVVVSFNELAVVAIVELSLV